MLKNFKVYQAFISATFVIFSVLTVIYWILYQGDIFNNNLLYNGIEVEAEIIEVICVDATPDSSSSSSYVYEGVYLYVSPEGKEYSGTRVLPSGEKYAQSLIGTKITIVIDPNGTDSTDSTLEYLSLYKDDISIDFTLACVFTGLLSISTYLFFYRVVYRNRLNKNILKKLQCGFVNNITIEGEVIKTFGLLWFYVKVKYIDSKGITQKKWARSWFTRKEAKFLEQKKFITIVPYKNTYGILEEMQIEKKSKKV